jgi:hypothetical protein
MTNKPIEAVLADPEWTRRVVTAAAEAISSIDHFHSSHEKNADAKALGAVSDVLRAAFLDLDAIRRTPLPGSPQ